MRSTVLTLTAFRFSSISKYVTQHNAFSLKLYMRHNGPG